MGAPDASVGDRTSTARPSSLGLGQLVSVASWRSAIYSYFRRCSSDGSGTSASSSAGGLIASWTRDPKHDEHATSMVPIIDKATKAVVTRSSSMPRAETDKERRLRIGS